jgi:hypothetical protein
MPLHFSGLTKQRLSELNKTFGYRLLAIPIFYVLIGMLSVAEYSPLPNILFKLVIAVVVLYTIAGPAEYLYWRSKINAE